jgi:hypothetical protein
MLLHPAPQKIKLFKPFKLFAAPFAARRPSAKRSPQIWLRRSGLI